MRNDFYEQIESTCNSCGKSLSIGRTCLPCIAEEVEARQNRKILKEGRRVRKMRRT